MLFRGLIGQFEGSMPLINYSLFAVRDRIKSFPYDRTMRTKSARPSLASHAAIVRIRIRRVVLGRCLTIWFIGTAVASRRRAASIANNAVRKWVRCRRKAASVVRVAMNKNEEGDKVIR